MLRPFILLLAFLGCSAQLWSQAGNLKSCLSKTKLFVELYNNKQYAQLYQQLDSALQSRYSKNQFIVFLEDSLLAPGGKILGYEHKNQTKDHQVFILEFERMKKEFHLSLNAGEEISVFDFYPFTEFPPQKKNQIQFSNPLKTKLDSLVHTLGLDYLGLPQTCALSIGIINDGNTMFYNYGETARGTAQLPDQQSVYEAGSITKTFTGLLLAQAIIENKIKATDDIRKYLPGRFPNLAYGNTPITPVHLVNHSSGLPRIPGNLFAQANFDSLNPYKNYTEKMLYSDLLLQVIDQVPGTISAYSNYGMAVLGKILERVYNKSYSELVKENILDKLSMKHSAIEMNENLQTYFLKGYAANGTEAKHWDLGVFAPAGALHSSSQDLITYLSYQIAETDSAAVLTQRVSIDKNEKLGFSWQIQSDKARGDLFWHNGATYGFSSFCGFIPKAKAGIVILSNASASTDYIAIQILRLLSKGQ